MKGGGIQEQTLDKYNYKKDKPLVSNGNYTVYSGVNKQTNVPVSIKILKYPHVQLGKYLKQMKDLKSQYIIRIFQLVVEQSLLILVTEQARFGNLKKALTKPQRLDQNDAIFISKILLSGHSELLRSQLNWFGTEEDIQFTDSGVKLSWNNGCSYNLVNPFPNIINKLYNKSQVIAAQNGSILPFPPSKTINELSKISKQNASQISMSPQMKKKQKITKKKGKDWLGLKQYKNKNQYFDQLTYFAVSDQFGFIRVKIYDQGKISPNLLALNKTKQYFTKIIDIRQEGLKTIMISEYANDGNLQSYVTKLKTNGITLKQDQIQFFIYSLFQPIKLVQQSSLMSINMLHIRNIFIQNGIPKIGQPIPINQKMTQVLMDRSDVPDFYHAGFKRDPQSRSPIYDTYSLGVLLYKLMYTQYPIFPNQKVHIPTTPAYNKRLKTTLQIFLNEGGTLKDIQQRIDVSQAVKKQVQENQAKLMKGFQKKDVKQKLIVQDQSQIQSQKPPSVKSVSEEEEQQPQQQQEQEDYNGPTLYELISKRLQLRPPQKSKQGDFFHFVDNLQTSSFKNFRLWSKTVFIFCLYVFVFFYKFLSNVVNLVASQSLLTGVQVNISNTNYTIITTDRYVFEQVYNITDKNLQSLQSMHCLYQNYSANNTGTYTSFLNDTSDIWIGYVFGGFAAFIIIMVLKAIQIHNFDQIKLLYKKHHGISHFNMLNWLFFNLFWLNLITGCYFLFNFIFYPQIEPCVGFSGGNVFGSTNAFFNNHLQFIGLYVVIFLLQVFAVVCYLCVMATNDNFSPGYNVLLNPISIFGSIMFIFFLIIRFGVILGDEYYPAAATDSQGIIKNIFNHQQSMGIFGFFPELLFLIQIVILIVVDLIYYWGIDKSKTLLGNETSNVNASLKDLI